MKSCQNAFVFAKVIAFSAVSAGIHPAGGLKITGKASR
jgi:hypothetical protein